MPQMTVLTTNGSLTAIRCPAKCAEQPASVKARNRTRSRDEVGAARNGVLSSRVNSKPPV